MLYMNPDFDLGQGTGNIGVVGNANLRPEKTIQGELGLQQQISSILSNVDPALIDSISELLAHVNAADQSLIQSIAQLQSDHDDLKARFDQLVDGS